MSYRIIQDDREKNGYDSFPGEQEVVTKRLETGDYTIEGFEDTFAVERKSLDDLANSCGTNRDRFEAEIKRAQDLEEFVVVIEAHQHEVKPHNYWSNIHPNAVKGTVGKWPAKYDTLAFKWCGSWRGGKQETLSLLDEWYLRYSEPEF